MALAALLALLSACAGSVSAPVAVTSLPAAEKTSLRLKDVVSEAAPGIAITPEALSRVSSLVVAEIKANAPLAMAPGTDSQAKTMKILFTRYDEGNAAARFLLAGLGQIYIDADVSLLPQGGGAAIATYRVSKNFSFGGLYGGTTGIQDVEKGFAKSVAEIVKP
jgi:hypothetical protein